MNFVTLSAYAKINLALDVIGKRADGYHELRMIMQSVSVHDTITLERMPCKGVIFECGNKSIPADDGNLAVRAVKLMLMENGIDGGVKITLEKRIPSMAGMAGGSADGAAALIGTDMLFDMKAPQEKLLKLGRSLGADVPFCIVGGTKICEGIGEKMTAIPHIPKYCLVILKPQISVSTPAAFAKYDRMPSPERGDIDGMAKCLEKNDIDGVCKRLFNALEYASGYDEITEAKNKLLSLGADGALMTGSGSAVFGIFKDKQRAEKCCGVLKSCYPFCEVCYPVEKGCEAVSYE